MCWHCDNQAQLSVSSDAADHMIPGDQCTSQKSVGAGIRGVDEVSA